MQITYLSDPQEKKQIAQTILADLPEWFGLPESTADYIEKSAYQEMIVVENKGFLTLVKTSPATAEIYVMGVLKADHHQGIGSQLIQEAIRWCQRESMAFLQVKKQTDWWTVQKTCSTESHQATASRTLKTKPLN